MNITHVTKQKGAALLSRICAILEPLCLWVGSKPTGDVPAEVKHKRYTFAELMEGVTPEKAQALNAATAWALEGTVVGEELA